MKEICPGRELKISLPGSLKIHVQKSYLHSRYEVETSVSVTETQEIITRERRSHVGHIQRLWLDHTPESPGATLPPGASGRPGMILVVMTRNTPLVSGWEEVRGALETTQCTRHDTQTGQTQPNANSTAESAGTALPLKPHRFPLVKP